MRSGCPRWGRFAALAVLAACAAEGEPADLGATPSPVPVASPPTAAVAAADVERGVAHVREAVFAGEIAPATLDAFLGALTGDPAALRAVTFQAADLARLFASDNGGENEPGASHLRVDLDGDGADEVVVAIGDGWWGRHVDFCVLAPGGGGWRLAHAHRLEDSARGIPQLSAMACGGRAFVAAGWVDGWGTGIWSFTARLLELVDGRLVEVLQVLGDGELSIGGHGIGVSARGPALSPDPASDGVLATVVYSVYTSDGLGDDFASSRCELTAVFRQGVPGGQFLRQQPPGTEEIDLSVLLRQGLCSWFDKNADSARRLAREGTDLQKRWLHRACRVALEAGPHAATASVAALLPPDADR